MSGEPRLEGTFLLEGLVEGRLDDVGAMAAVRAWVDAQAAAGLHFALEVDGPSFSLLPAKEPVRALALGPDPGRRVEQALGELVKLLPPSARAELYSTLHGVEVRPNQEVQTVYAVAPSGTVRREERVLAADTVPPTPPMTSKGLAMTALAALGVLAVLFAISSIFVDWREQFRGLWHQVKPLADADVRVDATAFSTWFTIERQHVSSDSRTLVLDAKRTAEFPVTVDGPAPTGLPWARHLALDAVARGFVHAEVYDDDGAYVGSAEVRVAGLRAKETVELRVPLTREPRPAKVVLVP